MDLKEFRDRIDALPAIDTHEHWAPESFVAGRPLDFFDLLVPYVVDNLTNAGMTVEEWAFLARRENGFEPRWNLLAPYLDDVVDTTYFRTLLRTLKVRYGLPGLGADAVRALDERLAQENVTGVYGRILDRENVECALTFVGYDVDPSLFGDRLHPVPTVSDVCPRSPRDLERLSAVSGVPATSLDGLEKAVAALFDRYAALGVKAVKFGTAYRRTIDFRARTREEAEAVLVRLLSTPFHGDARVIGMTSPVLSADEIRPLDDHLTDLMVEMAREKRLPVFFHTGIHAWNWNSQAAAHAAPLEDLVRRHPGATFILLHCGAPFVDEAALLCRYYPNVHLNLTWTHVIDAAQARLCVRKYVEMLPASRIQGFGGDYLYPQQLHGALSVAKENLALGLWPLVEEGELDAERAVGIARKWLHGNPKKVLGL